MRSWVGVDARDWPGGELSMFRVKRVRGYRDRAAEAGRATAGAAGGAFVPMEISKAMGSDDWIAAQIAGPLEWQQAVARTQCCCAVAASVEGRTAEARQPMPQVAPPSGAST